MIGGEAPQSTHAFLADGGETGRLIAAHDWGATSLGPIETWPGSLRTALGLILRSAVPIVMLWGPDGVMLYNDAYSVFAGGRHPRLLGSKVREGWPEVADFNDHVMRVGLAGGTLAYRDQELTLHRHGRPEQVWMNLDYSPVLDESGQPAGVVAIVVETTERVLAERTTELERARLRRMFEQAPGLIAMVSGPDHVFELANPGYLELMGRRDVIGRPVRDALPEIARQGHLALLDEVYRSGRAYVGTAVRTLVEGVPGSPPEERYFDFVYQPLTDAAGQVTGIFVEGQDVTERARAEARLKQRSEQLQALAETAIRLTGAPSLAAILDEITRAGARIIGAHQGVVSLNGGPDWSQSITTSVLSEKYAAWRDYAAVPDGSGIYAWVCAENRPVRMTQAELEAHPLWRGFGAHAHHHPPMRGWLAAPLVGRDGRNLGLIQLSDKEDGTDFDASDEAMLVQLAQLASGAVEQSVAEATISAREAHLSAIFEQSAAGLVEADAAGRLLRVNDRFCQIVGRPREALLDLSIPDLTHPEDLGSTLDLIRRSSADGKPFEIEKRYLRPDGSVVWVHNSVTTLSDREGRPTSTVCVTVDINEFKRAEVRLRESEAELQRLNALLEGEVEERTRERDRIFQLSNDLFAVAGFDGYLKTVNPAWSRLLGYDDDELLSRPFIAFVHPDDHAGAAEVVAALQAGDPVRSFEDRLVRADGSSVWIAWTAVPEGERFYAVGRDVTQDRLREDALRQSQKMEAVGQLTGGIAHDFNNLLAAVVGSLDLLRRRTDLDPRAARYVDNALTAAERGAKLTAQLLAFSRAQRIELKSVAVSELVAGMRELLTRTLGPMIRVAFDLDTADAPVVSDPTQLEMAVLNLAINARDAMPEGGDLTVATRLRRVGRDPELAPGDYIELAVADTGTGMPPEVLARAFDPFFTTKEVGKGTGLGLSQVYGMARQAGGTVRIESLPGRGTTVRLLLRRTGAAAGAEVAAAEEGALNGGANATVLVVDDDPQVRRFLTDSLDALGYRILEAADGRSALEILASTAPDLMLVDFAMPGLNGAEVARAARVHHPDLPIVFASGYAETAAIEEVAGPEALVLRKPFRVIELQAVLQAALGERV